jgi:hypothetical protein
LQAAGGDVVLVDALGVAKREVQRFPSHSTASLATQHGRVGSRVRP